VFCSVGFVFVLPLCFVKTKPNRRKHKGKAKTKPTKQNTKAKQKRKPTEEKRGQYKRSQPKEGLAYQASHTTPVVECLLLYSLIDISANICLTRQCLTIQIPVKDLNYTPFVNPKKSSESLLEPLSKIMCIMVSFLSFYIIRSEMLNYCFHGNGGHLKVVLGEIRKVREGKMHN
jgi:hypothetical protein